MSTPPFKALFAAAAVAFTLALPATTVHAQDSAVAVDDYAVFVDLPTAFAFIKLPTGWKFIGKLDASQLRQLPPDTLTSLLPVDGTTLQLARDTPAPLPVHKNKG